MAEFKLGMRSWPNKRIYEERAKCPRRSGAGEMSGASCYGRGDVSTGRCPAGEMSVSRRKYGVMEQVTSPQPYIFPMFHHHCQYQRKSVSNRSRLALLASTASIG